MGGAIVSVAAITILVVIFCKYLDRDRATDRVIFSILGALVVGDYFLWRATETLAPFSLSAEPIWHWVFFSAEAIPLLGTMISFLVLAQHSDYGHLAEESERRLRERWRSSDDLPAVDVFICTYNEELSILEKSILAALAIDYPNHTVYVLDDKRRPWLRDYCEKVGAKYVTRANNIGAKAGNLNNGLRYSEALTNAPYILILDADFAADSRILLRTLKLFDDEKVAIVQTPQFYYNADPIQHNLLGTRAWVDEQRLFFDVIEPAKDAWGTAFCVGTSFIVRRDLINRLGGYPVDSVAEDLFLSYRLMTMGYVTRWLNEKLSVGLSAEGLSEYVTQRTRWCLGAIQVAALKDGPLLGAGYTFTQRLHFVHGLLHWFGRPFVLLMLLAPVVYWLFGLSAIETDTGSFVQHGISALIVSWGYGYWRFNGKVLPLLTEVSQIVAAGPVLATIATALVNPFGQGFKVTPKGGDRSSVTVHWPFVAFFGGIIALTLFGMWSNFLDGFRPSLNDPGLAFNVTWSIVAMILCFTAILVSIELPRNDAEERFTVAESATARLGGKAYPIALDQLSVSTASFRPAPGPLDAAFRAGDAVSLELDGVGWIKARVASLDGDRITVEFEHTDASRASLITRIFSRAPTSAALEVRPWRALYGVFKRAFADPQSFGS